MVQSAETLVPGKSRVALSRQSQIPAAVIPVAQVPEALTPVAANRARGGTRNGGMHAGARHTAPEWLRSWMRLTDMPHGNSCVHADTYAWGDRETRRDTLPLWFGWAHDGLALGRAATVGEGVAEKSTDQETALGRA